MAVRPSKPGEEFLFREAIAILISAWVIRGEEGRDWSNSLLTVVERSWRYTVGSGTDVGEFQRLLKKDMKEEYLVTIEGFW